MAEGIIQKVFNQYYGHQTWCKECVYAHDEVLPKLIAEIKKEYSNPNILWSDNTYSFYTKLIGDS